MKIRAFITQKKAEKLSDCQDRFAVNKETMIVAVSDGVSQSIFPDLWANLLVEHYTSMGQLSEQDRQSLCQRWKELVLKYIEEEKSKGNNPWRTESNLAEGLSAGATLCGVKFTKDNHWTCDVLGDSCLIKINEDNSIEIISSEDKAFDTYPDYLDSNPLKKGRGLFKKFEGDLSSGCKLLLVSDPFSDFFYKLKEKSKIYIDDLLTITNHEEFVNIVAKWRDEGMHNDDSTVVIIEPDDSIDFNIDYIDNLEELIRKEEQCPLVAKDNNDSNDNTPTQAIDGQDGYKNQQKEIYQETSLIDEKTSLNEESMDSKKKKNNAGEDEIIELDNEKLQKELVKQISPFLDLLITKDFLKKHFNFKFILQVVFAGSIKRSIIIRTIIDDILNNYVKSIKI